MLQTGEILGEMYQVICEIGKGGTGVIYLGYHLRLQKQVVIKRIKENLAGRIKVRAEADILKKLHHTYLPQVYDFLEVGNEVYTVMEYISGYDLQFYINQKYTFPETTLRLWLEQMCEVLDYLHTRRPQIFHSDIKPGNIMITQEGNICLIDFNISIDGEITKDVQGISINYASPEQFQKATNKLNGKSSSIAVDERMDIYSTGAVFYSLMTGLLPNAKSGIPYSLMQLDVPYSDGFKAIVEKATEQNPSKRFRNAKEMEKAIQHIEKMSPKYRKLSRLQMSIGFGGGVLLVAGLLLIFAGIRIYQNECWEKEYTDFYNVLEEGNQKNAIQNGTEILNDSFLRGYLKRNPELKAEVLYGVGEAYYNQQQYNEAAEYYEEALTLQPEETYLSNYLIALIRDGQQVNVEVIQAEHPTIYLNQAKIFLIKAQTEYMNGNFENALENCEEALEYSIDQKQNGQIYQLEAEIYTELGESVKAADAAEQMIQIEESVDKLRYTVALLVTAGNEEENQSVQNKWYEKAENCYRVLCSKAGKTYEDEMNYALALRAQGKYADSNEQLQEMKKSYPEEYKIPMWMCFNFIGKAEPEGWEKILRDLKFTYSSCKILYDKSGSPEDSNMEELEDIMRTIQ